MHNMIVDYIKKNLIISAALSLVVAVFYYFYRLEPTQWTVALFVFLCMFGACSLCVIVSGLFFPKYVIKDYVEETDPDDYVTIYFYEKYNNGYCRVIRMYGDPNFPNDMDQTYNFVDSRGELVSKDWFLGTGEFENDRVVVCIDNYEFNVMNEKGELICKRNYPGMSSEVFDGKVKVADGEGYVNFVDVQTGDELWRQWKKEMTV